MGRQALHTSDIKIEQKDDISDRREDRAPEIVRAEQLPQKDYLDELAFNEEPVTIRLEPSAEKNAAAAVPFWVNGKGCEIFENGQWREIIYVPVGRVFTTKRKYVAVMAAAKYDTISTVHGEAGSSDVIENRINRFTSAVAAFSVIEDKNPRGAAWLSELRRRNF